MKIKQIDQLKSYTPIVTSVSSTIYYVSTILCYVIVCEYSRYNMKLILHSISIPSHLYFLQNMS